MNLFSSIPATLPNEITETLVQAKNVRIERIVSQGHASPPDFWYDQEEGEFVLLIQGAARLQFEEEVVEVEAGDWISNLDELHLAKLEGRFATIGVPASVGIFRCRPPPRTCRT
jgi:cupin 2 domain-containing protein